MEPFRHAIQLKELSNSEKLMYQTVMDRTVLGGVDDGYEIKNINKSKCVVYNANLKVFQHRNIVSMKGLFTKEAR